MCDINITGPSKTIAPAEGLILVELDLDLGPTLPPNREIRTLSGLTVIDSTSNSACAGERVIKTCANAWGWLAYPLTTQPGSVSADGRTMEGNLTESQEGSRSVHTFRFTAMRE